MVPENLSTRQEVWAGGCDPAALKGAQVLLMRRPQFGNNHSPASLKVSTGQGPICSSDEQGVS